MTATSKPEVLRKRQIAQNLQAKTGLKLKVCSALIDSIFDQIAQAMASGIKVNVKDFGIFVKVDRPKRMGRNPRTREQMEIKESKKPRFSASKTLKEAMVSHKYASHADESLLRIVAAPEKAAEVPEVKAKIESKPAIPAKKAAASAAKEVPAPIAKKAAAPAKKASEKVAEKPAPSKKAPAPKKKK